MVITRTKFSVEYSGSVMFRYSANIVKVRRLTNGLDSVDITVNDINAGESIQFTLQWGDVNTMYIDISRALQALMVPDIEVVISGGGESASFYVYSINGARGSIEHFGGNYSIRRWGNLPLSIDFLFYDTTELNIVANNGSITTKSFGADGDSGFALATYKVPLGVKKMYAEGEKFTGSWESDYWEYNITEDCARKNSIYLRWTDIQGLTWYWLFDINDVTTNTSENIKYGRMPSYQEGYINEWEDERSKIVKKTAKIGTYNITAEEYKVVKTLASSVIVDAYDEDAETWYRVRVADGDYTDPKGNYKEVEFTIEFAPINTQLP